MALRKFLVLTGQAKKEDFVLIVGYTGWSSGQLQDELDRGANEKI